MKQVYLVLLLSVVAFGVLQAQQPASSAAQGRISGKVIDSASRTPIEYASITVFTPNGTRPVNGASTNNKGAFTIEGLAPGNYTVTIDFIGYQSHSGTPVTISDKALSVSIGEVQLAKKGEALASVTVTAPRGLVENKIDKMIYNAEKDITSQGGVATDILKKVPMVSVDVDGNVELQGNSNILFLINGKPSSIFGNNITDALQSIPAGQIKSIEVITSPGAKYDAEGTGGIINIVLKDAKMRGINGNISLTGGSRLQNGSLNLNGRQGNIGINAFFSGNAQLSSRTHTSS